MNSTLAGPALALALIPTLSGCVASALVNAATAPVRMAGKAVDMATTSQSEADEKRGRDLRRREERLGKLEREYNRYSRQCQNGDDDACDQRDATYDAIERLRPTIPYRDE